MSSAVPPTSTELLVNTEWRGIAGVCTNASYTTVNITVNRAVVFSGLFPRDAKLCSAFLRYKMYLIRPETLLENSIPFCQVRASILCFV